MNARIADYALIGDTQTGALVSTSGSIDWLCLPRFDSGACFAALLGTAEHGHWLIAPADGSRAAVRSYQDDTLVLETTYRCDDGEVCVVDCMPLRGDDGRPDVVRRVIGRSGSVRMRCELVPRFDYGIARPWTRREGDRIIMVAGPDRVTLDSDAELTIEDRNRVTADFTVSEGRQVDFRFAWSDTATPVPRPLGVGTAIEETAQWWRTWVSHNTYDGDYRDAVVRSLITLKALTYAPTGGIVAAPTTSLPEQLGGVRNWDYRFCWIRDATLALLALLDAGYTTEARDWREWLLRAVAGDPEQMQIMYGIDGRRRLTEQELDWLPGFADSRPVRIGNEAAGQFQLDVYGELMDVMHQARTAGVPPDDTAWNVQRELMDFLESAWREPDNGIWEMRGPRRHFTFSKLMAWVAVDRAVKGVEHFGLPGDVDKWRRMRTEIFDEVCTRGFDSEAGTFTQYYGSTSLDASLLLMANVGFLPATDPRVTGTVEAIEKNLCRGGFVQRYTMTEETEAIDGLPTGEGAFLACTFWLADNYVLQGRHEDGRAVFERLLELRNDVGLLAEEYDPHTAQLVGNFPQALSHIPLINTAISLHTESGPVQQRAAGGQEDR